MPVKRKYLVDHTQKLPLSQYQCLEIFQDYLYMDDWLFIRKKRVVKVGKERYWYMLKEKGKRNLVKEVNQELTQEEYEKLALNTQYVAIHKKRYWIPYVDQLVIFLDVYEDFYEGLMIAEIRYKGEEQIARTPLPLWFKRKLNPAINDVFLATHPQEKEKMF